MVAAVQALAGQVAIVTGAGRGIGRAVAAGLAEAGAGVALLGRDAARLDAVRRDLEGHGRRCSTVVADVTCADAVIAAVREAERTLGPIDLLVNNAGRIESREVPVWEADPEEWWAVLETNLRGPFNLVRAVVPGMVARGCGRVVDLSSGFGARDTDVYSAYAASKAALFRLGGAVAMAGSAHGVRAFEVAPGLVQTDMSGAMPMHAQVPADRWTPPERVVELIVAVASGRLDALSGRYLRADKDDVDTLEAEAERITAGDGRMLRVLPWGPGDPLG